jgi:hypothetical protein
MPDLSPPVRVALAALTTTLLLAAPAAAHDAEIFATNNTAVITDPADPRLQDHLEGFARKVERIVREGGGTPRGSQLLDGVFFSSDLDSTTLERSRDFAVDHVSEAELHRIGASIAARFDQESVLTFDRLQPSDPDADAIELEVPGVSAQALRDGLLADAEARERLFGGSVTLGGRLILVAERGDEALARAFAARIGGNLARATTRYGAREFVEPAPVELRHGTLRIRGTAGDDRLALDATGPQVTVDLGDDGPTDFAVRRGAVCRIRIETGEGEDGLRLDAGARAELTAHGGRVRVGEALELGGVEELDLAAERVTVRDLTGTLLWWLHGAFHRTELAGTDGQDNVSVSAFGGAVSVIGLPVFVQIDDAHPDDALRIDGRDGRDDLTASTLKADAPRLTLDAGADGGVLIGGDGDDMLIGGDGFDDARGGRGDDVALLGGYFDRFNWSPGDGSDRVDGGASHDSLFFLGTAAPERVDVTADGHGVRLHRDVDDVTLRLDHLEEIDPLAGGGADTFALGDLSPTPVDLVDISLSPGFGSPAGDGESDGVLVTGTDHDDSIAVAGSRGTARVTGLSATVNVSHAEVARDTLAIDTGAGDDEVDSSALAPDTIGLSVK